MGYVDNDKRKIGDSFYGKKVYSPEILESVEDAYIVIANKFRSAIIQQINNEYPNYVDKIVGEFFFYQLQLLKRYAQATDPDLKDVLKYIESNDLEIFNYHFTKNYSVEDIDIKFDTKNKLFYYNYLGRKMYISKQYDTKDKAKEYIRSILIEQDNASPHVYLKDEFQVPYGSIVVDAGGAEGCFSLSIIDKAKKIYLFEPDPGWIEALRYTFEDYKEKVLIIEKALSDYVDECTTKLDVELKDESIDFIKMDIEGEEYEALLGMERLLSYQKKMKCVICTYHQEMAYGAISDYLRIKGFSTEPSRGYMFYPDTFTMRRPVFRRGLVRAWK